MRETSMVFNAIRPGTTGDERTFLSFSYCAEELRERMPAKPLAALLI